MRFARCETPIRHKGTVQQGAPRGLRVEGWQVIGWQDVATYALVPSIRLGKNVHNSHALPQYATCIFMYL
jgi:hypothetical protein